MRLTTNGADHHASHAPSAADAVSYTHLDVYKRQFHQDLAHQPCPRRAQCYPYGQLPRRRRSARQLQIRQIRAGDQQYQPRDAHQQTQIVLVLSLIHI